MDITASCTFSEVSLGMILDFLFFTNSLHFIAVFQVICTAGPADVRATLTCLVTRLQKYCNTNIAPPSVMKVGLCGSDSFLNSMLRPYVELFSSKPPDWQNHILFYVIPLGNNTVSKGLAAR